MHVRSKAAVLGASAAIVFAMSHSAVAGGNIHIDTNGWVDDQSLTVCHLGDATCSGTALGLTADGVNTLYVYQDGIVGFGGPLGGDINHGLAGVTGGDYFAPSFGAEPQFITLSKNAGLNASRLTFNMGSFFPPHAFEIYFDGSETGFVTVSFGYGAFGTCAAGVPECGFAADGQAGYRIDGATLDFGVGHLPFNEVAVRLPVTHLPGVPEPSLWMTLILGFAGLGIALRRRRQALRPA